MSRQVSYNFARQNLAELLNEAEDAQEPVIISRPRHQDIAVIPAEELQSLLETAHLLRSPKNAQRLLTALQRALGNSVEPQDPTQLRDELGLR